MAIIIELLSEYEGYLQYERRVAKGTLRAYLSDLKGLGMIITKDVAAITLNDLRAYQSQLGKQGLTNSTIIRKFDGFRTFWKWLILQEYTTVNVPEHIRLPRRNRRVPKWLTEAELVRFANTPVQPGRSHTYPFRDAVAWKTLAWLGLRRSEVLSLKVADVQVEDATLVIRHSKGDRDRVLPLPAKLQDDLRELIGDRAPDQFVFSSTPDCHWSVNGFTNCFKRHLQTCGLENRKVTPHTIRHSFATQLVRRGVPLPVVKALLGHSDIKTTMVYVHVGQDDLKRAIAQHVLNAASTELEGDSH